MESGFTKEKLARLIEIKASRDGRVADYAKEFGLVYLEGQQPWSVPVDIALPCATQNELDVDAAHQLIANGVKAVTKELTKAENKKAAAEAKAMEEAKKSEAEDVLKKLLASGMSADEIVAKLQ